MIASVSRLATDLLIGSRQQGPGELREIGLRTDYRPNREAVVAALATRANVVIHPQRDGITKLPGHTTTVIFRGDLAPEGHDSVTGSSLDLERH